MTRPTGRCGLSFAAWVEAAGATSSTRRSFSPIVGLASMHSSTAGSAAREAAPQSEAAAMALRAKARRAFGFTSIPGFHRFLPVIGGVWLGGAEGSKASNVPGFDARLDVRDRRHPGGPLVGRCPGHGSRAWVQGMGPGEGALRRPGIAPTRGDCVLAPDARGPDGRHRPDPCGKRDARAGISWGENDAPESGVFFTEFSRSTEYL